MAQTPDIRIVVGAKIAETQSVVEGDLKQVAKQINVGNRIPHVTVGIDVNASRQLFEKQFKEVIKGLSVGNIDLSKSINSEPIDIKINTDGIINQLQLITDKLNKQVVATATVPVLTGERKKDIDNMINSTVELQKNISKAYAEWINLTTGKKISQNNATKYLNEINKAYETSYDWTLQLTDVEDKYYKKKKKSIDQELEYKSLIQTLNEKRKFLSTDGFVSGLLNITKDAKGYSKTLLKNITPVDYIKNATSDITNEISKEFKSFDDVNKVLEEHSQNVIQAVDAESKKANQSIETANNIEKETNAINDSNKATKKHSDIITAAATQNIKEFEKEVQAFADARAAREGYDLATVKAVRGNNSGDIIGAQISYNKKDSPYGYTALYNIEKLEDGTKQLVEDTSHLTINQKAYNSELAKTALTQQKIVNKLINSRDSQETTYLKYKNTNQITEDQSSKISIDFKEIDSLIAQISQKTNDGSLSLVAATDLNNFDVEITAKINKLKQKITQFKQEQSAATQLRTFDVTTSKSIQTENLDKFITKVNNANLNTGELAESISKLRTEDIVDSESLTKFLNGLDIAKAKYNALYTAQANLRKNNTWLNSRETAISGVLYGATNGDNKLSQTGSIEQLNEKYKEVKATIESLRTQESSLSTEQKANILNQIANLNTLLKKYQEYDNFASFDKDSNSFNDSITKLSNKYTAIGQSGAKPITALSDAYVKLTDEITKYQNVLNGNVTNKDEIDKITVSLDNTYDTYKKLESVAKTDLGILSSGESSKYSTEKVERDLQNLINRVEKYAQLNDRFTKNKGLNAAFIDLQSRLNGLQTASAEIAGSEIPKLSKEFSILTQRVNQAGLAGQSFGTRFKSQLEKLGVYFSAAAMFSTIALQIRNMTKNVIELDSAMTELKKVTDETDKAYTKFLDNAETRAKRLGATLTDVVTATANFSRMGYTIEEASKMADAALVSVNVWDDIKDIDEASNSIISALKAFGLTADQAITVVDKYNIVSNNFAVTSGDIANALADAGAALSASGNGFEESIALFVSANEIIQDYSKTSAALRTISSRLRNSAGDLEKMEIDSDGAAESITKLQQQLYKLSGVNIMLDNDTFKSTTQILRELSSVWKSLSDVNQAEVTRLVSGTRQASVFSSLLSNFSTAEDVITTATKSENSALAENERYLDSINGKISQFQATYQSLSNTIINSDLIKFGVEGGTKILEILDSLLSGFSGLPTVIGAATAALMAFKNKGFTVDLNNKDKAFDFINPFKKTKNEDSNIFSDLSNLFGSDKFKKIKDVNKILKEGTDVNTKYKDSLNKLSDVSKVTAENIINSKESAEKVSESFKTAAIATQTLTLKQKASIVASKAMSAALNMAIGIGIGIVLNAAIAGITALVNKQQNAIDKAKELSDTFKEQRQTLSDNKKTIVEFADEYKKLSKGIGVNGEQLSLTTDQYDRYHEIANQIADMFPDLVAKWDAENNAILKVGTSLDIVNEKYDEKLRKQRESEIADASTTLTGFYNEFAKDGIFGASTLSQTSVLQEFITSKNQEALLSKWYSEYQTGIGENAGKRSSYSKFIDILKDMGISADLNKSHAEYVNKIINAIEEITAKYNTLTDAANKGAEGVRNTALSYLQNNDQYEKLNDEAKSLANTVIKNLNATFYEDFGDNGFALGNWVESDLVDTLSDPVTTKRISEALNNILNPNTDVTLETFRKNIINAFNLLPDTFKEAFRGTYQGVLDEFDSNYLKSQVEDKIKTLNIEEYKDLSVSDIKIILNPDFEFSGSSIDELKQAITTFSTSISPEVTSLSAITTAISDYNKQMTLLNSLYAEQETNGKISAETYDYILKNYEALTGAIEVQRDALGNVTGYQIVSSEIEKYADEQHEAAITTLTANNATADQIAMLDVYEGVLGSTYERITDLVGKNNELAEAYTKAKNAEKFSYEEMIKLKNAYPDLQFELDATTNKYELYTNSALQLITDNNNMITSIEELRLKLLELQSTLAFIQAGWTQQGAENTINALKNIIDKNNIKSYEEYLTLFSSDYDTANIPERTRAFVESYTAYLNEVAKAKEEADARQSDLLKTKQEEYDGKDSSSSTETAFSGYKKQLDLEKQAIEESVKLDPEFIVYNIQTMTDYYNKISELAKTAYDAEEIDAIEYQQYIIESYKGLKDAVVNEYSDMVEKLDTEKSKMDAGMLWDTSVISNTADYYDKLEKLTEERYAKNLINAKEYADAMVTIFGGRNDLFQNTLDNFQQDIDLWQNQDNQSGTSANRENILDTYRQMQEIVHQQAEAYREKMSGVLTEEEIENSETIKNLQNLWWGYVNNIEDILSNAFESHMSEYENYIARHNKFAMWGADNEVVAWKRALQFLDSSYANDLITYKKYLEEKMEILGNLYDAELERREAYQDAVKDILDKEIESLEKQKEIIEQNKTDYETTVSTVTDAIQERIDTLQKENDNLDKQLELQKAIQAVETARSQKNKRVYREGVGFVWEADNNEVTQAQESLDKLQRQNDLQSQIDALEAYKQAWQATIDDYQKNIDKQTTASILGANWEQDILNLRTDNLGSFAKTYKENCDQLDEKTEGSVAFQIRQLEEMSKAVDDMFINVDKTYDQYEGMLADIQNFEEGSYAERYKYLNSFTTGSISRLQELKDQAKDTAIALAELDATSNTISQMQQNSESWWTTDSSDDKTKLENDNFVLGTSLGWTRGEDGYWYKKDGTRAYAQGGVIDYTGLAQVHGGSAAEMVLNNNDVGKVYNFIHDIPNLLRAIIPTDVGRSISSINNNEQKSVTFTGDIIMHGVNDLPTFAKEITTQLKLKGLQAF